MTLHRLRVVFVFCLSCCAFLFGCDDASPGDVGKDVFRDTPSDAELAPGELGGPCYPNDICNSRLTCLDGVCVVALCASACENGGVCTGTDLCTCADGWEGATCTTPVCDPACQHGGSCTAPDNCTCIAGWGGTNCSAQIDRVRIPATGATTTFTMGRPASDVWGYTDEQPAHQVTLSAYYMDRYLVTAGAYQACVDAGVCTVPDHGGNSTYGVVGLENHPVNYVDWEQATAYCAWTGGRLPTEAEWERAAKGETHRRYPWGDDCPSSWHESCSGAAWSPTSAKANCRESACNDGYAATSPVDAFPAGVSPDGIYDMAGNVEEWVNDWSRRTYTSDPVTNPTGPSSGSFRVIRGGSWYLVGFSLRAANCNGLAPSYRHDDYGFRCASDAPQNGEE